MDVGRERKRQMRVSFERGERGDEAEEKQYFRSKKKGFVEENDPTEEDTQACLTLSSQMTLVLGFERKVQGKFERLQSTNMKVPLEENH